MQLSPFQHFQKKFALRLLVSVFLCCTMAYSFILVPSPKRTIPFLWRGYETFCQQDDDQLRCWELNKLRMSSTKLRDSTGYDTTESVSLRGDIEHATNGAATNGLNGHNGKVSTMSGQIINLEDVPQPTDNGGYTHTAASRAKIGAANKGKTPWNKGKNRSEAVKAKIAAGVRRKNRERFLEKLKEMGMTEEEYEAQQQEEKRKQEQEKMARRTEKGGYRPTEETKAKISKILKEKHARGEIKPRTVDPKKVRRGFTHSEETRAKISESLKNRWATDTEYRKRMKSQVTKANTKEETRKRISQTLKKKWQDPEFRSQMLEKIAARDNNFKPNAEHRRKISEAMKAKWQDKEYREKTLKSIAQRSDVQSENKPSSPRRKAVTKGSSSETVNMLQPRRAGEAPRKKKRARKKVLQFVESADDVVNIRQQKPKEIMAKKKASKSKGQNKKEPEGSVNRLREERRDLFDLLYGDEEFERDEDEEAESSASLVFEFGDEDLDAFDPYGLEDY